MDHIQLNLHDLIGYNKYNLHGSCQYMSFTKLNYNLEAGSAFSTMLFI